MEDITYNENNVVNDYWWDEINSMTTEQLVKRILFLGGTFVNVKSDASDAHVDVKYCGWTIKAAGESLQTAYKHALDSIYWVREDFSSATPNTIVSI